MGTRLLQKPVYISMGNSNEITVSTDHGDVVVHKMPLSDYADLLRALDKLPDVAKKFVASKSEAELRAMTGADLLPILPALLADAWQDIISLVAVPTDKSPDFLAKISGPDAVDVIVAIIELNDFKRIMDSIKKLTALKAKIVPTSQPPK